MSKKWKAKVRAALDAMRIGEHKRAEGILAKCLSGEKLEKKQLQMAATHKRAVFSLPIRPGGGHGSKR